MTKKGIIWLIIALAAGIAVGIFAFISTQQNAPQIILPQNPGPAVSTSSPGIDTTATSSQKMFPDQSVFFSLPDALTGKVSVQATSSDQNPTWNSLALTSNQITFSHSIDYPHPDPCDFKGTGKQLPTLADFSVSMRIYQATPQKLVQFAWGSSAPADSFFIGAWHGTKVTQGVEGCGYTDYFLPISSTSTLVVQRTSIAEFAPINGNRQTYLALPGIIPPDQEEADFKALVSSVSAN